MYCICFFKKKIISFHYICFMRKLIVFCFCFTGLNVYSQSSISIELIEKTTLKADRFIGVDDFEAIYFIRNNTLIKETEEHIYNYQNTQLGEITSVDVINSLKILIFYKAYNTVVFVDKFLNELSNPINFSTNGFNKNVEFVNIAYQNQLWLYSRDDNRLHLWDFNTQKVKHSSKPLSFLKRSNFLPHQQLSQYNDTYLSDGTGLLKFNEYAQFESSLILNSFSMITRMSEGFIFEKNKFLFYQNLTERPIDLTFKERIKFKNIYTRNTHLYIFDGASLFTFNINKN